MVRLGQDWLGTSCCLLVGQVSLKSDRVPVLERKGAVIRRVVIVCTCIPRLHHRLLDYTVNMNEVNKRATYSIILSCGGFTSLKLQCANGEAPAPVT